MDTNYEPFFSVITPSYNSGKTISESIKSVLGQSFTNYELIIIDGLSTDDTVKIASSFKDDKLQVLSAPDKGIYDAMNKGIKMAKGQWLYFLGSDDTLYDDTILAKVSDVIKRKPKTKIVFGDVYTSDDTIERYTNYQFTELLDRCINHQAIFYHHTLFADKLYSLEYKISSDWDFNLQVFTRKNHPVYLKQLIAKYNLAGASGDWQTGPEYLNSFKNKKDVIIRYKGKRNLYFYLAWYYARRYARKIKNRLAWMFQ
jgi:glycosyltransferase involved in cell wall biosynthesis